MGVNPKIGGKPPKMDGENISWKTLLKWDDLGGFPPLFLVQHPDIQIHPEVWCLIGMFLGSSHTEPQLGLGYDKPSKGCP